MPEPEALVLGVDSSTQSTKVLAMNLASLESVAIARAPHSGLSTQDPREWWSALKAAVGDLAIDRSRVVGISVAGQQHGLVQLDATGEPVCPAPLWNNTDAAPDADRLNTLADFPEAVGSSLVASFTIAKLAHAARTSSADLARTAAICLPHDYVTRKLTGQLTSDRSDASGSGWWSPSSGSNRRDLIERAAGADFAERVDLATVLGPDQMAGTLLPEAAAALGLPAGIPVGPGAGDNAAAAIGIGATITDLVVSLGTSGVVFAVSDSPTADPSGEVCGFADASGRFLPLVCMINCTRAVDTVAAAFELGTADALALAGRLNPGSEGLWMLPYLGGERTPNLPRATGQFHGMTQTNVRSDLMIRAAVDGVAAGLAYCRDALLRLGIERSTVTLVGGGSRHATWQHAIADAIQLPVIVRGGEEHCARGAALQIAAIVRGESVLALAREAQPETIASIDPRSEFRAAFRADERNALIAELKLKSRSA
jgi:xylulokinase